MTTQLISIFILTIAINSFTSVAFAHENEQVKLDKACEAARQVSLTPRKKVIYQECRQKLKKSEAICREEAKAYNGNRINGAPLFYELPACEKAFSFRKKHTE